MLERILTQQVFFYFVGAVIAIGILAKLISGISLKRLVRAASNMGKSNHALMKLVRAKFEHACMVSDKVQNVRAFVDKYVYEFKVLGLRLHAWQHLEKTTIWLCGILSLAGAGIAYSADGADSTVYQYIILGSAGMIVLLLLHITSDERYQMEVIKTYMVDFLENTYAHRYTKKNRKEFQVTVEPASRADEAIPLVKDPIPVEAEPQEYSMPGVRRQAAEGSYSEKEKKVKNPFGHGLKKKKEKEEAVAVSGNAYMEEEDYRSHELQNMRSDYEQYGMQSMRREYMPEQERAETRQVIQNESGESSRQDLEKEAKIREILEEFLA